MNSITVRYRWTVEDLIAGRRYAQPSAKVLMTIVALTLPVVFLASANDSSRSSPPSAYEAALVIVVIVAIAIVASWIALKIGRKIRHSILRRQFAKRPDANHEVEWKISNEKIHISTPDAKTEVLWPAFQRVISTPAGFLFMPNKQIFHFIPIRAFDSPSDIEKLKEMARKHARTFKELK